MCTAAVVSGKDECESLEQMSQQVASHVGTLLTFEVERSLEYTYQVLHVREQVGAVTAHSLEIGRVNRQ